MPDELNLDKAPTQAPSAPAPTSTETAKTETAERTYTAAELEQIVKERITRERAKAEKAAAEAAERAAAETAAKNGEWEKLAKQHETELARLQAELKAREIAERKRAVAEKNGLPASLASRLVGETEAELEADAKALLETLPKPQTQPRSPGPVNPGANAQTGETDDQRRARITGAGSNPFDLMLHKGKGGGGGGFFDQ